MSDTDFDRERFVKLQDIAHHAILMTEAHVQTTKQYGFVMEWLTPVTKAGSATLDGRTLVVRAPRPESPTALAIVLHECAHVILGHLWRSEKFLYRMDDERTRAEMRHDDDKYRIPNEVEASQYALNTMRLHDLAPADLDEAEQFLVHALVCYGASEMFAHQHLIPIRPLLRYDSDFVTAFGDKGWVKHREPVHPGLGWRIDTSVGKDAPDPHLPAPTQQSGYLSQDAAYLAGTRQHPDGSIRTFKCPSSGWTWLLLRDPS